jgi:hypothetical protein
METGTWREKKIAKADNSRIPKSRFLIAANG